MAYTAKILTSSEYNALEGTAEFKEFYLVSVYVPNAGSWFDYRTKEWDKDFKGYLLELSKKKAVVLAGDLNVANTELDIFSQVGMN